jgi:urea transport system ATP-binding protein
MDEQILALEVRSLTKNFGGMVAVDDVDFCVEAGELRFVIGTNGAGKTTLFNLVTGWLKPTHGTILFDGVDVGGLAPHRIASMGIGRKFQSPNVFLDLSVADNLRVAAQGRTGLLDLALHRYDETFEGELPDHLDKIRLREKKDVKARSLSHGQQQWLEIGMVLASKPSLLLLDEPTAGMTMAETRETVGLIREIAEGVTTVVIEHDISFVKEVAKTITVMYRGRILCEGCYEEIECDETVRDVYLGRQ